MKSPEGYEKDAIKKYLVSIHAWHFMPYMAGYGKSGVPDIIFCYRGQFGSIEVKRESKKPTVRQDQRLREVHQAGGWAFWGTASKVIEELSESIRLQNEFR